MVKDIWEGRDSHMGLHQHSPILESKQAHGLTEIQPVETRSALHSSANPAPHLGWTLPTAREPFSQASETLSQVLGTYLATPSSATAVLVDSSSSSPCLPLAASPACLLAC